MVAETSSDIVTFGDENQWGIVSIFDRNRLLTAVLARRYLQISRENQILNEIYIKNINVELYKAFTRLKSQALFIEVDRFRS